MSKEGCILGAVLWRWLPLCARCLSISPGLHHFLDLAPGSQRCACFLSQASLPYSHSRHSSYGCSGESSLPRHSGHLSLPVSLSSRGKSRRRVSHHVKTFPRLDPDTELWGTPTATKEQSAFSLFLLRIRTGHDCPLSRSSGIAFFPATYALRTNLGSLSIVSFLIITSNYRPSGHGACLLRFVDRTLVDRVPDYLRVYPKNCPSQEVAS